MRNISVSPGEYYHIFNRGVNKQSIFLDDFDKVRFLFLVLFFQSSITFPQIGRVISSYVKHSVFDIDDAVIKEIVKSRFVEVTSFCLMPNHFHILLKEVEDGGIARYMQRVLNSYSKYFNTKYKKSGHLFQGPYRVVHVQDDRQLMHLSAYIHKNPKKLVRSKNGEMTYKWSSYQDIAKENRWGGLLIYSIIVDRFKDGDEYEVFVKSSAAKELENEIGDALLD